MSRLIDADALEVVTAKVPKGMDAKSYIAGMEYVLGQIDAMPTIEPQRKMGKWMERKSGVKGLEDVYICPFCKYEVDCVKENFCPNCGADMKGEEHEPTMKEFMYGQDMGNPEDGSL